MAKKRRTSNVQRQRASAEALNRRIDQGSGSALPDWRLLLIGGVIVVGVLILALVLIFGGGPAENVGVQQADDGRTHVADGTDCRNDPAQCGTDPYSSIPAVSGPHWGTPAAWGVYSSPLAESQSIHNLEHGGIVIQYGTKVPPSDVDKITSFYRSDDNAMLVAPFPKLGNKIAVEAWTYLSTCTHFDQKGFTKFRDALRYHGPEHYPKSFLQPGQ
jgi:Protein of unknown function (DUF3105)